MNRWMNTCELKIHLDSQPNPFKLSSGTSALCIILLADYCIAPPISPSENFSVLFSFYLPLFLSLGGDCMLHLLSFFFLLRLIPLSSLSNKSISLAFISTLSSPNTLILSLHPHLLWRPYPDTNSRFLICLSVFIMN